MEIFWWALFSVIVCFYLAFGYVIFLDRKVAKVERWMTSFYDKLSERWKIAVSQSIKDSTAAEAAATVDLAVELRFCHKMMDCAQDARMSYLYSSPRFFKQIKKRIELYISLNQKVDGLLDSIEHEYSEAKRAEWNALIAEFKIVHAKMVFGACPFFLQRYTRKHMAGK